MKSAVLIAIAFNAVFYAQAQAADAKAGERVAQAYCVRCHDISAHPKSDPATRSGGPPPFVGVIKARELTEEKMRGLLRLPHGEMNTVMLAQRDIDDVIAFVMSRQPK